MISFERVALAAGLALSLGSYADANALPDSPWTKIFFGGHPPLLDGERTAMLTLSDGGWEMVR